MILIYFIFILIIVFLSLIYSISNKLSKSSRVNANLLLVEGWLNPDAIEMAYNEFKNNGYELIVTTGANFIPHEYYLVDMNGYLIFYPQKEEMQDTKTALHKIEVDGYGALGGKNSSRFNVYINNSLICDFSADKTKKKYRVEWEGKLCDIDSIMIQFINDGVGEFGDKNLYIKELIIDDHIIIPYQNNSVYDISTPEGKRRIVNRYNSAAQLARRRLISLGLDSSLVVAIPGKKVKYNRTLSSALVFREWLKTSPLDIKGINIISVGTHSKRTWMIYNKILDKSLKVGIISLPDSRANKSMKFKILNTIRESFGIVYYWFVLLAY